MAFPTSQINTTNLDSDTDDPSLARADLLSAVTSLNTIISEAGTSEGAAVLDINGQIPATQIPNTIAPTVGVLTLTPTSGKVKIQDVLRLQILSFDDIQGLENNAEGDVVYCSNGDAGSPCLAVYTGTDWLRISVGSAISTS